MTEIIVTDHAYDRGKERLSLKATSLYKMAEKAYNEGLAHSESKGYLHEYITKLWFQYRKADNIRIHADVIFFFQGETLITLYQLPPHLKKWAKVSKEKRQQKLIPKQSAKQKERMKRYMPIRNQFLKENPKCARCGGKATSVHHGKGRLGDLLFDTRWFIPLCDTDHPWAEEHPNEAKALGISMSRLAKDDSTDS